MSFIFEPMTNFINMTTAITFAIDKEVKAGTSIQMIYVINLEDGGGQEFYVTSEEKLISLSLPNQPEPQEFRSLKLAMKRLDQLRPKYPATCRLYALERTEFNHRRELLQKPKS